jgi:hypothetical protein
MPPVCIVSTIISTCIDPLKETAMKVITTLTALMFASAPAFAAVWGEGNPDTYGTILNDPTPAFVGTSMADSAARLSIYGGFASGELVDGFRAGGMNPRTSANADEQGSILVELGVRR